MRGLMKRAVLAAALSAAFVPGAASADDRALSFGLEGGVLLPGFESLDPTAFALTSWTAGAAVQYGLTWDLWAYLRFSVSAYSAKVTETRTLRQREFLGQRTFSAITFLTELGGRYDLISGYDLSLFLEGSAGFLWSQLTGQQFLDEQGIDFGIEVNDEGQPALLLSVGLSIEYRLLDLLLISVGARFARSVTGGLYQHHLMVPVSVSFPFFL